MPVKRASTPFAQIQVGSVAGRAPLGHGGRVKEAPFVQRLRGYDVFEAGHRIRRLLPSPRLSMVGPFVLFDHFGPATLAPGEGIEKSGVEKKISDAKVKMQNAK